MRFKKSPQLPGAGRTSVWHYQGSHTPTSPEAILLGKMAYPPKQIRRKCTFVSFLLPNWPIKQFKPVTVKLQTLKCLIN